MVLLHKESYNKTVIIIDLSNLCIRNYVDAIKSFCDTDKQVESMHIYEGLEPKVETQVYIFVVLDGRSYLEVAPRHSDEHERTLLGLDLPF